MSGRAAACVLVRLDEVLFSSVFLNKMLGNTGNDTTPFVVLLLMLMWLVPEMSKICDGFQVKLLVMDHFSPERCDSNSFEIH